MLRRMFLASMPAALRAQEAENIEVRTGVEYARYGPRVMHLDLFLPKQRPAKPMPAVIYIHGGGWRAGNPRQFHPQAKHMATLGYAGACIEYRLSGEAKWPAAIEDCRASLEWVRSQSKSLAIDARRIGAAGGSAGGHLAALLGTTAPRVLAVAAFNPALDFVSFGKTTPSGAGGGAVTAFLGKTYAEDPKLWEEATPLTHVSRDSAPFLFLHGTADTTVPIRQSQDMMAKLKKYGVQAEMFTAEGAAHGFFNRPPWYEPTLKRMVEFFASKLA